LPSSSVNHPLLAATSKLAGRRPQIDFAVHDPYPTIKVAVETKWVGKSNLRVDSLVWDLLRLEMISHHFNAETFFVLGGRKDLLNVLMKKKHFVGPLKEKISPILRLPEGIQSAFRLDSPAPCRITMLKKLFAASGVYNMPIPCKILCRDVAFFPTKCRNNRYQVYAWQIRHAEQRSTFVPANHAFYK
jgi:hypothetical protein